VENNLKIKKEKKEEKEKYVNRPREFPTGQKKHEVKNEAFKVLVPNIIKNVIYFLVLYFGITFWCIIMLLY